MVKKVFLGGDNKSHEFKARLKKFLEQEQVEFVDLGIFNDDGSDYKDIEREVNEKVIEDDTLGILIFGKKD